MLTLLEIQTRFESAILSLAITKYPKAIPDEIKILARSFKQRSRMSTVKIKPEELVIALLNVLAVAAELGFNLEARVHEVLNQIENPAYYSS